MLSIKAAEYFIPDTYFDPILQYESLGITKAQAKVYSKIYGIEKVPYVTRDMSMQDLLFMPIQQLQAKVDLNDYQIKYLIHAYTSSAIYPFGLSMVREIAEKLAIPPENAFATSINKCVSIFTALEMAAALLQSLEEHEHILIFTGEIGFTPELRIIPNTSITGDAAACIVVGKAASSIRLLKTGSHIHGEFARGIWMNADETALFERQFIALFCEAIHSLLRQTDCRLEDIKLILPHNINLPTWQKMAKALSLSIDKIYLANVKKYAHCFNADLIINLTDVLNQRHLQAGDLFIAASAGVGAIFSVALFRY